MACRVPGQPSQIKRIAGAEPDNHVGKGAARRQCRRVEHQGAVRPAGKGDRPAAGRACGGEFDGALIDRDAPGKGVGGVEHHRAGPLTPSAPVPAVVPVPPDPL